ncbi:gliding motility-associated C-terminal domain-containing protein [Flavivirga sp. 57AJ16]|uniref:HYR-like domain-containing protein n=1 Tax=Flavivirga sp. 57AJ16 TaxID=3025307 RepID=UPI0023664A5A|nr:gliding motility-associated C-terminal domain-containing protein [Flavivirga sp. 57AJ16]MDD7885669.1 gliding motility-associated C-terminal domain-containing protein [Flavivirga sp. 57AJ16]
MKIFTKYINYHKAMLMIILLISAFAQAQLKNSFDPRFNEAVNGDFAIIANNMISTTATGDYIGANDNNQFSNLVYVDIDNDNTTFNSSSANFVNPAPTAGCLTIKKVLLYWAASDQEPDANDPASENQPNWNYNDIKLMLPSETSYTTYTADEVLYRGREDHVGAPNDGHFSNDPYFCVKDITSSVTDLIDNSISPYGTYQVANVEGKIGALNDHDTNIPTGVSGGWQIVFVYESPILPLKNIAIFDGYGHVVNGQGSYNIDFNGFQTVPVGNVNANILVGALEGDLGLSGDRLQIENSSNVFVDLSTSPTSPIRTTDNFFNSKITIGNADFTDRTPASTNTLGFDAAIFQLSNPSNTIIGNNQTSATFRLTSTQETYGLFLLGFSVDVWSPNIGPIHLTLDTPNTSLSPGDTFGASFTVENKGNDNAVGLEVSMTLPPQVTLIEPIALPAGITYTNSGGLLTFFVDDDFVNVGDPAIDVDFDLQIQNDTYFLETDCTLDFNLQLEATYQGEQNPAQQSTLSSASLDACGVGILDPVAINVIQPTAEPNIAHTQNNVLCNGESTGDINITVTNGVAPYTYSWIGPDGFVSSSEDISNLAAGIYTVTVTDSNVCEPANEQKQITITEPALTTCDITVANCPPVTGTVCADSDSGSNVVWTPPSFAYECCTSITGDDYSFFIEFDLPEGSNACWDYNRVQRIGSNNLRLFQSNGTNVDFTTPLQYFDNSSGTPINMELIVPSGTFDWTLQVLDGANIVHTQTITGISSDGTQTITIPNTVPSGAYKLKFVFDDNGTGLGANDHIEIDRMYYNATLLDTNCANGINFVVTSTHNPGDLFVPGETIVTYTATYTPASGDPVILTCDFDINVVGINTSETLADHKDVTCADGSDGSITVTASGGDAPYSYSLDNVDFSNTSGVFNGLAAGTHTIYAKDNNGCSDPSPLQVTLSVLDSSDPVITAPSTIDIEGCDENDITALNARYPYSATQSSDIKDTYIASGYTASDDVEIASITYIDVITPNSSCPLEVIRTYTITDTCGNSSPASQTINITPTAIIYTNPVDSNVQSCDFDDQTEVNTAFDNWVTAQSAAIAPANGCSPVLSNNSASVSTPLLCDGGTTTVTWTITDLCETINITADFNLTAPTDISFTNPANDSSTAAELDDPDPNVAQANLDADIAAWVADQTAALNGSITNGCAPVVTNDFTNQSITFCNSGTITITWTITDLCETINVSANYSFTQPEGISFTNPSGNTVNSCDFDNDDPIVAQNDLDTSIAAWVADQTAIINGSLTGGSPTVSNDFTNQSIDLCTGGSITVTWTIDDICETITPTATYTLNAPNAISFTNPIDSNVQSCDFADQTEVNTAFDNWVAAQSATMAPANGCSPVLTNDSASLSAPVLCDGGTTTVTWTITDLCETINVTADFNLAAPIAIAFTNPIDNNVQSCDFADQTEVNTAFDNWVIAQSAAIAPANGCSPVLSNDSASLSAPVLCDGGTTTVTWTITDLCETINVTADFNLAAPIAIAFTAPIDNNVQSCDFADQTEVNTAFDNWVIAQSAAIAPANGCSPVLSNDSASLSAPVLCDGGTTTVTWTITDLCETINVTADFNLTAPTAISFTDPANDASTAVELDDPDPNVAQANLDADIAAWVADQTAIINGSLANGCAPVVTNDFTDQSIAFCNSGTITITWTITDLCETVNASANYTFTQPDGINFIAPSGSTANSCDFDNDAPNVAQANLDADIAAWVVNQTAIINGSLTGGSPTVSHDFTNQSIDLCSGGSLTVTWTIDDICETLTPTATYTLTAPTEISFTNPVDDASDACEFGSTDAIAAQANLDTDIATWVTNQTTAINSSITGGCSPIITNDYTNQSIDLCTGGSITVTWTVADLCETITQSATYTFTQPTAAVFDQTTLPADNLTFECDSLPQADVLTASNSCGNIDVIFTETRTDGNCPNRYSLLRTWTATNICGVSATHSQTVTVTDNTPPVLTLPANQTAECSDDLSPIAFGTATAIDNCDANPVITFEDVRTDGACSGTFTITRTWTATDACGNIATADQTISTSDTTAPEFEQTVLPGDITVECSGVPAPETLTATDNCGTATVEVTEERVDGNCANNYTITRTYTATDECGLTNTHIQTITVQDTTPPVFEQALPPLVRIVECDAVPDAETLTATDTCGSATVTVNDVRTDGSCTNNYTIARTWTATDACGLTTTHTQIITVQDTTAPSFEGTLPATNITVECDAVPNAETLTATDNCGDALVTVNDVRTDGDCPNNYTIARTWTATDECGLTTTHTQVITVQDTTAPVPTSTFDELLNVSCTDIPDVPELTFTDNCSTNITVVFNETNSFEESVFADYEIVRTWTVRDECNNEEVYTQTLQVSLDEVITDVVAPDWCYDEGAINMNNLLPGDLNTNGTWELLEGDPVATLNDNIFDPSNLELSVDFLPESGGIDYRFRYTTTDAGCISITEITMNVHADCVVLPCGENDITISKAVTPNGDAYNEYFEISGIELCGFQYDVKIFNRWGALVYESDNYQNDWNGTANSASIGTAGKVPNGTYYYIIKLLNSGLNPITGPVYLGTK